MSSQSNRSEGAALSMDGATDECSFLNFSKAFLFISSFCSGSEDTERRRDTNVSAYFVFSKIKMIVFLYV